MALINMLYLIGVVIFCNISAKKIVMDDKGGAVSR